MPQSKKDIPLSEDGQTLNAIIIVHDEENYKSSNKEKTMGEKQSY